MHRPTQAAPVTPWQSARGIAAKYRRDPEVRAMWWRLLALGAVGALMLDGVAEWRTAHRPTVEPYYVYINQEGHVLGTERVRERPYDLQGAVLERLAVQWLKQVRSIPLDVDIMKENWTEAMRLSTAATAQRLMAYAKAVGLTDLAAKARERELAVKVVVKNVRSVGEIVRLEWHETLYVGGGVEKETSTYTGEIEFIVRKPTTQKEIEQNPIGVWIGRFVWAKDQV